MTTPFKIPKRNLSLDAVSGTIQMQSPLSRLQDASDPFEKNWGGSHRGRADGIHCAYRHGTRVARESVPRNALFQDGVKSMLGLNKGNSGMLSISDRLGRGNVANCRADHADKSQSNTQSSYWTPSRLKGQRHPESPVSVFSNGWRPKRASDKLFPTSENEEIVTVLERKASAGLSDSLASVRSSLIEPEDNPLDESTDQEPEVHRFTPAGHSRWRPEESDRGTAQHGHSRAAEKRRPWDTKKISPSGKSNSDWSSEDDFVSPPRATRTPAAPTGSSEARKPPLPSSSSSSRPFLSTGLVPRQVDRKVTLNRTSWLAASINLQDRLKELRDEERHKRRERERGRSGVGTRPPILHFRLRTARRTPSEPIVLSSEEEEGGGDQGDGTWGLAEGTGTAEPPLVQHPAPDLTKTTEGTTASRVSGGGPDQTVPSVVELGFTAVHIGLAHAHASGTVKITDCGITIPFKASQEAGGGALAEDGVVTLVASHLRGYALWDGGLARGGALLRDWEGPVPSVLFFWVTDAQARLLKSELSAKEPEAEAGQACAVLLLSLREQPGALQAALLASMLDMEQYRQARPPDLPSPLDWAQGLAVLHSLPPPLDTHLLGLLGQTGAREEEKPSPTRSGLNTRKPYLGSSALQELPSRLIQYPAAPCKGRITVTTEDLACLDIGEFLNDVIIDFYLKYLLLERAESSMAERCHVFSSFFYKQLSRRRAAGEDNDAASIPDRDVRHQRVKTWTRNVDIFDKDFLFVPVNQESHWYLVVMCYPGLEEASHEEWQSLGADGGKPHSQADGTPEAKRPRDTPASSSASSQITAGGADLTRTKPAGFPLKSHRPPECTQDGWHKEAVLRRPCILLMDSLKLSCHENVCRLLRDYLHVEWQVRRGTPRLFTADTMHNSNCRVPLQDNSSDCGLYLLQYVESFLQNPVVHFDLPLRLEHWFPRQRVWKKREEIRSLVLQLHRSQQSDKVT